MGEREKGEQTLNEDLLDRFRPDLATAVLEEFVVLATTVTMFRG